MTNISNVARKVQNKSRLTGATGAAPLLPTLAIVVAAAVAAAARRFAAPRSFSARVAARLASSRSARSPCPAIGAERKIPPALTGHERVKSASSYFWKGTQICASPATLQRATNLTSVLCDSRCWWWCEPPCCFAVAQAIVLVERWGRRQGPLACRGLVRQAARARAPHWAQSRVGSGAKAVSVRGRHPQLA